MIVTLTFLIVTLTFLIVTLTFLIVTLTFLIVTLTFLNITLTLIMMLILIYYLVRPSSELIQCSMQKPGIRIQHHSKNDIKAQESNHYSIKYLLSFHSLRCQPVQNQKNEGKTPLQDY